MRAAGRLEYDSNVFRTNSQTAFFFGPVASDIRATPSLDFDVVLPVGRQAFFLNGSIGYDFYKRYSRLDRERLTGSAGANLAVISGCNTKLEGDYSRQQSSLNDVFSPVAADNTETRTSLSAKLVCDKSIGLSPGAGYSHEDVRNSITALKISDYKTDIIDASLGYARPTLGRVSIYTMYTNSSYPNRIAFGGEDGIENYTAGLRFERSIGSRITGTISGGYSWVNPKLTRTGRFRGAAYSANIALRPSDGFNVNLNAQRTAELSNQLNVNYSITDVYSLTGDYAFSPYLSINFGSSYQKRDFKGSTVVVSPFPTANNDTVTSAFIGARYQWSRRVTINADFTQEKRDSDNPFLTYKSSRVGIGVSLGI